MTANLRRIFLGVLGKGNDDEEWEAEQVHARVHAGGSSASGVRSEAGGSGTQNLMSRGVSGSQSDRTPEIRQPRSDKNGGEDAPSGVLP